MPKSWLTACNSCWQSQAGPLVTACRGWDWPRGGSRLTGAASAGTASPLPSPALALPALQEEAKLKCQELQRALRTVGSGGSVGEGGEPRLEMTGLKLFLRSCVPRKVGGLCGAAPGAGRVEGMCGSI